MDTLSPLVAMLLLDRSCVIVGFFLKLLCSPTVAPARIEDINVTIKLSNRDTITPLGIVRDVEVLCGQIKYPTDFLVLGSP